MTTGKNVTELLTKALPKAMAYADYKTLVSSLINAGKSTGDVQTEAYLNYSKLSERRMKRWDKVFKLSDIDKSFFDTWDIPISILTLSEGWCGDAAHALPIFNKISEYTPHIKLRIILRDQNEALMEQFLTNGSKSIPKVLALNTNNEVLFTWGPRPSTATKMVKDYKEKHGNLTPQFKEDLQKWYNKDKGRTIIEDIKSALQSI